MSELPADPVPGLVDEAERRLAIGALDRHLLVEAAAGSGKTTLLLGRVVALVRGERARLSEIAAITFTEKAAADLRIRLRAELTAAGLHEALRDLEHARIGTIHGFAAGLLRERPVEAGVDPGFTVVDPLGALLLRDAAWESWLAGSVATAPASETVRRAAELGLELARLRELAEALVERRDCLDVLPGRLPDPEPPEALDRAARDTIERLSGLVASGCRDPLDRAAIAVSDLGAWAVQTAALPTEVRAAALREDAPVPEPGRIVRLGNQRAWRPRALLEDVRRELGGLADRVAAARTVARHNLVVELAGWARGFVDAYQARKARAGCLDFEDLLLRARDLVRDHPAVRRDFQAQVRYLLVDEFQDTDPLQLEMILTLMRDAPPGALFIVGDPKQSIYRFRGADIETYQEARVHLTERGEVLAVRVNFRSTAAILEAVNRVFELRMVPPPDGTYQPAYVALEPGPATPAGRPPRALEAPEDSPATGDADADRAAEAGRIAAYLRGEVDRGAVRPGEVALLFRTMTGVTAYESALRDAGLPFHTLGGRHYYDRSEVGWAIAALAAIEDPHDPVALLGALRSPFFGFTDDDLLALHRAGGTFSYRRPLPTGLAPAWGEAWALLDELHRDRNAVPPPVLVERLLVRTQVLAAYALDPDGEARLANLLKVLDTARALEASGVSTFRGLVRWLRARGAARQEEEESSVSEEGGDAIRLLTVHRAKGLEFPVVILADPGAAPPSRLGRLIGDRRSGGLAIDVGDQGRGPFRTVNWEAMEAWETTRADAERLRLLYVALTRARRELVVPVGPSVLPGSFLAELAPLLELAETVTVAPLSSRPAGPGGDPAPRESTASLAAWRADRAALRAAGSRPARLIRPSRSEGGRESGARGVGRAVGALVHAALAAVDLGRPESAGGVVDGLAAREGYPPEVAASARRLVERALRSPVMERARRADWVARELPVTAEVDGAVVDGRVDLVFEEAGGLAVVEFKTDADEAGEAAGQVRLYAEALTRALGRPIREALVLTV